MLSKIRLLLRFTTETLDAELDDLILGCKADLALSGISSTKIIDTDSLILRAVSLYCQIHYEIDNVKAERLQRSYDSIKAHLALSVDYQ